MSDALAALDDRRSLGGVKRDGRLRQPGFGVSLTTEGEEDESSFSCCNRRVRQNSILGFAVAIAISERVDISKLMDHLDGK